MQIQFTYDASVAAAPAGFTAALSYVAGVLDALITNPITVNINVGWNEIGGVTLPAGAVAEGGPLGGIGMSYTNLVAELKANASNRAAVQGLASLPATAPSQIASYYVSPAQEKAWGLLSPTATAADGEIGFSSAYNYSFDPNNQSAAGLFEFIGIAEHEIAHALGRIYGDGALELVNYAAPGVLATPNSGGYFSTNGGVTNLGQFAPSGDTADWAVSNGDSFEYVAVPGLNGVLTPVDKTLLGVLGFNETPVSGFVSPVTVAPVAPRFGWRTRSAIRTSGSTGGTVPASEVNANVTGQVRNAFIHTGFGNTTNDVSAAGGGNGVGGAASSGRSALAGLPLADSATMATMTPGDFGTGWLGSRGNLGSAGMTGRFSALGQHEIHVTMPRLHHG